MLLTRPKTIRYISLWTGLPTWDSNIPNFARKRAILGKLYPIKGIRTILYYGRLPRKRNHLGTRRGEVAVRVGISNARHSVHLMRRPEHLILLVCHHFGSDIDLHSGGQDLEFPHHENEIAQCEAFYSQDNWCPYFLHTGPLLINSLKMSKSLGNMVSLKVEY